MQLMQCLSMAYYTQTVGPVFEPAPSPSDTIVIGGEGAASVIIAGENEELIEAEN